MKKNKVFDSLDYALCENCLKAKSIDSNGLVLCEKYGLIKRENVCKRFELDLLKVNPKKLRSFKSSLTEDDFKL